MVTWGRIDLLREVRKY